MGSQASETHLLRCGRSNPASHAPPFLTNTVGKILKDEETVASYNIEEKGFVVCMVNKVSPSLASHCLCFLRQLLICPL